MPPNTENSDFEVIEHSSSSSSSSSPPNRSSGNQDANNQTDQNDASKQPTELVYQTDFATRDEIIFSLIRYTRAICGEKAETSEKLMNENIDLYQALISLPLKSSSDAPIGSGPSKVVLDLNSSARSQIVTTLMANQSLIVDRESASVESKMQMVEQNGKLTASLATLPVRVITGSANATSSNGHSDRPIKRAELAGEVTRLKEIIEEQTAKNSELTRKNEELATKNEVLTKTIDEQVTKNELLAKTIQEQASENSDLIEAIEEQAIKNSELTKTIEEQATENSELIKTIEAICNSEPMRTIEGQATQIPSKKEIKRTNEADLRDEVEVSGDKNLSNNKLRADFECKLGGAETFLVLNERRYSRYFYFNDLAWQLEFAMKAEGKNRFLSIFLRASSCAGGSDKWSANVFHVLSVLNQSGGEDCALQCVKRFSTDQPVWGWPAFIWETRLRAGGFIKENKIKVRVTLQLSELVKYD